METASNGTGTGLLRPALHCPFCDHVGIAIEMFTTNQGLVHRVVCGGCHARGPERLGGDQQDGIDAWNQALRRSA